ncbi:MAG: XRE family transcriptional regulator, partial [Gemmatimonadaceae bacterium]
RALGPKSQHVIAPSYGIPQPRVSNLGRGQVDRFNLEWLIGRVHRMGGTVELTVDLGDVRSSWIRAHAKRGFFRIFREMPRGF